MKIVCDSCGAKYSIADEKVAGKVFKIRCKKCSAVVVVRGDQIGGAAPAAPAEDESSLSPEAIWHVVVDGEQQGPHTPEQVGWLISAGTIDWETYVWRDGFEDWIPASEVGSLVEAITGQSNADRTQVSVMPEAFDSEMASPFTEPPDAGENADGDWIGPASQLPAGASSHPPAATASSFPPAAEVSHPPSAATDPGVAQRVLPDTGADLFADVDAANHYPPGAEASEPPASQPPTGPRVSAEQAMTGQRNENSVLFSLSNLQALATGQSDTPGAGPTSSLPAPASPGTAGTAAAPTGEGSGLIDIRQLANAAQGSAPPVRDSGIEDLLSIGGGGGLTGTLGAPSLSPVKEESSKNVWMFVAIAAVLVVVVGGAYVVFSDKDDPGVAVNHSPANEIPVTPPTAPPTTPGAEPAVAANEANSEEANGEEANGEEANGEEANGEEANGEEANGEEANGEEANGEEAAVEDEPPTPEPELSPAELREQQRQQMEELERRREEREAREREALLNPTQPATPTMRGGRDIDNLLDEALGGGGRPAQRATTTMATPANSSLPATPSRGAVQAALRSVAGRAAACGQGQHGTAMAAIVFRGTTGRVASANVSGQFAGSPIGSCVARAVRGARVPPFQQATFSVNFPYRL